MLSAGFTVVNKEDVVPLCTEPSLVARSGAKSVGELIWYKPSHAIDWKMEAPRGEGNCPLSQLGM